VPACSASESPFIVPVYDRLYEPTRARDAKLNVPLKMVIGFSTDC
jgi:hypothetical protein